MGEFDLSNSYVIGDRPTDIQLALNLGAKAIYVNDLPHKDAVLATTDWGKIYKLPQNASQIGHHVNRNTNETKIQVTRKPRRLRKIQEIETGLGFFDHMLDQISRHGNIDLEIKVEGRPPR